MPNLMFWNTKNGSSLNFVRQALIENDVDVLILAEDKSAVGVTESIISTPNTAFTYKEYRPVASRVRFFTRLNGVLGLASDPSDRISVRTYDSQGGSSLLIAGVHLPSKLWSSEDDQYRFARSLRETIEEAEIRFGHSNSLLIGDFNMSPFEKGMVAYDGLHGVMEKSVSMLAPKFAYGKSWSYFYNPMWSRIGDESEGPSGTCFFNRSGTINYFWHNFDQILLRPSLLPMYSKKNLRVITRIGATDLLKGGRIDASISDHLPLTLSINLGGARP